MKKIDELYELGYRQAKEKDKRYIKNKQKKKKTEVNI